MRKMQIALILFVVAVLIAGCGGKGPAGPRRVYQPDWWMVQDSPEYVHTFGMGERVTQNTSFDQAKANAMLEAAQYVESYVQGMVKNYQEEVGVEDPTVTSLTSSVVKNVSNAQFSNTLVTKQEMLEVDTDHGKRIRTYVRVSIPKDTINKNLVDQIKREEALYNAFKASQAFDELEKEIDRYGR